VGKESRGVKAIRLIRKARIIRMNKAYKNLPKDILKVRVSRVNNDTWKKRDIPMQDIA
jgi:hypothetical protein